MSEAETKEATEVREPSAKEAIYIQIGKLVQEKTGKRIGKTGGREIFDLVVNEVFAAAARNGSLRFNGGFGALHQRQYQAGERRLPSGATTKFGIRTKLRYEEGVVVKALNGNGGVLEDALKARGSRKPPETKAPAKTADKKEAAAKAEPATAEADDDLDLD